MNTKYISQAAILAGLFSITQPLAMAGTNGTFSLDTRLRFETAEIDGKEDGDNTSLRLRPGYTTPEWNGFQLMAEGEFTFIADKDSYNAAGVHGDTNKASIADAENVQLDQLWLSYKRDETSAKVGRQLATLDNHRWLGHVGWRQSRQTYDAVTVQNTSIENLTLFYGYIDNVVRIFGDDAPSSGGNAEEFGSDSHLINAAYKINANNTVTGYGYFLDLDDSPGKIAGSDTIGASYKGVCTANEDMPITLYLEYANQTDAGSNPQDYSADYYHAAVSTKIKGFSVGAGYELLGSDSAGVSADGTESFASVKSPLATLHKWNGFADVFLVTPDKGLEDIYASIGYTYDMSCGPISATVWYHDFSNDEGGADLGDEIDAVIAKGINAESIPGKLSALVKYASYNAPSGGADVERLTLELNYGLKF